MEDEEKHVVEGEEAESSSEDEEHHEQEAVIHVQPPINVTEGEEPESDESAAEDEGDDAEGSREEQDVAAAISDALLTPGEEVESEDEDEQDDVNSDKQHVEKPADTPAQPATPLGDVTQGLEDESENDEKNVSQRALSAKLPPRQAFLYKHNASLRRSLLNYVGCAVRKTEFTLSQLTSSLQNVQDIVQDSASNLDDLVQNILKLNDKLDHVVSDPFLPSVRHPDDVKELQDLVQS